MANIIKQKQPELVTLRTAVGLQTFQIAQDTTKEQRAIIVASTGLKIADVSKIELEVAINKLIGSGLLLLGHKNHLSKEEDQMIMARAIAEMIRLKFYYRTMEDLIIIFNMGIRGQLRSKPEEVVYLNIEQVTSWFERYRTKVKPEAMKKLYDKSHPLAGESESTGLCFSELQEKDPELAEQLVENFTKGKKPESRKINRLEIKPITESIWIEELKAKMPTATVQELAQLLAALKDQQVLMFGSVAMLDEVKAELDKRIELLSKKDLGYFLNWIRIHPTLKFSSPELVEQIETELATRNKAA